MRFIFGLSLLLTAQAHSFCQVTKFVQLKGKDFTEEYTVLKNETTVKHGKYTKYTAFSYSILEAGNFTHGEKDGLWEYFHNRRGYTRNSIKERGNYVNGKKNGVWTSFYVDTIADITKMERYGSRWRTDSIDISIEQKDAKLKQIGMYLNDRRVGDWYSLDYLGQLSQKYNFSKSKLSFDISILDSLQYNSNRNPLFIGGFICLSDLLNYSFNFSDLFLKVVKDTTTIIASFQIDTMSRLTNQKIIQNDGPDVLRIEFMRLVGLLDNNWIPGLVEGKKVNAEYRLALYIYLKKEDGKVRHFRIHFKPL